MNKGNIVAQELSEVLESKTAGEIAYSDSYKVYVLAILFLGYILNTIDRGVFGILIQPIKEEFLFTDTQLGLLGGLVFAVFYAVTGISFARLSDTHSRVNVLTSAMVIWSAATVLCGYAVGFLTLFAARVITAIGESGGTPTSHSLISDYFPPDRRGTALSIFAMAVPVGVAVGSVVTGWLNVWIGWRFTFVAVGLPGIVLAVVLSRTIKEPPRGHSDLVRGVQDKAAAVVPRFPDVLKYLCSRKSFMHMSFATALHAVVWYSGRTWDSAFFFRSHQMDTAVAGTWLGVFAMIGVIGTFLGGYFSDRLSTARNDPRWYMWVPGIACLVMVPFQFIAYLTPSLYAVLPSFSVMALFASAFFGPSFYVAQSLATVRMRAVSSSILIFIQSLIGLGLGPLLAGVVSDYLEPAAGTSSLAYGLAFVGLANVWAAIHYFLGAKTFVAELKAVGTGIN